MSVRVRVSCRRCGLASEWTAKPPARTPQHITLFSPPQVLLCVRVPVRRLRDHGARVLGVDHCALLFPGVNHE